VTWLKANCLAITYLLISETRILPPHFSREAAIAVNRQIMLLEDV
jgi:hypothetical protein